MIQFAISKGLNVRRTIFPHKIFTKRHDIQQMVGKGIKQIVLISHRFQSAIAGIRA